MEENEALVGVCGWRFPDSASPLRMEEPVTPSRRRSAELARIRDGVRNQFRPIPLTRSCDMTLATMASPTFATMPGSGDVARSDMEVVELPLLLPRWQAQALEAAATRRGMTTGQILRRVIGDLFGNLPTAEEQG